MKVEAFLKKNPAKCGQAGKTAGLSMADM